MQSTLYYVHDPMCSWCWGFRPAWDKIRKNLPEHIHLKTILGGLAPDSNQPMPNDMCTQLLNAWHNIQDRVPGTRFNFDFWKKCSPRRSTYPACRAVIAARNQNMAYEDKMIRFIQEAYYLFARNPSNDDVLIDLAVDLDLDIIQFSTDLNAKITQLQLLREIQFGQSIGARGFPSLIREIKGKFHCLHLDYNNPDNVLNELSLDSVVFKD